MKKSMMILGISGLVALSGCTSGENEAANRDIYKENGDTINVNDKSPGLYNENEGRMRNDSEDFGYVRHQKTPMTGERMNKEHYSPLDREELAKVISELSTDLPNVNDVATLVTDEEVLIAYETDSKNRSHTADQVKKTALSVVPRYFHVYVTDNTNLRMSLDSAAQMDSDSKNAESTINDLIKRMKASSPQGKKVGPGENENGETAEDMKSNM